VCSKNRDGVSKHQSPSLIFRIDLKKLTGLLFHRGPPGLDFYNQSREVEELSCGLNNKPQFLVLLGHPSLGKTALTQYVASQKQADNTPEFHLLTVDLRSMNFLQALVDKFFDPTTPTPFWEKLFKSAEILYNALRLNSKDGRQLLLKHGQKNIQRNG
jgi:AAA+ ATPase superfamily predicted ATPase